jgi:2-polyprenyl-3-methyl-5-hydroxy-6-metoxy-1,4-benzoquinol methylase
MSARRAVAQPPEATSLESRARQSRGISSLPIYEMVARVLDRHAVTGGTFVDVGCGAGDLRRFLGSRFDRYLGVDAVRYDGLPEDLEFHSGDLDGDGQLAPSAIADVVVAVETIEHLENPRRLVREMVRIAKPGGWVVVTTPNQLSWLSLATLIAKQRFVAFQEAQYPAHISALLEVDLQRIFAECGLHEVETRFSEQGRIVFTARHYPRLLARLAPRRFSDNMLIIGRVPVAVPSLG